MPRDLCTSYSFSFQLKTCQDIRYYRKTNPQNDLKLLVEKFTLDFIKDPKNLTNEIIKRGTPGKIRKIEDDDKFTDFTFSFKKSTILKIRAYKKKPDVPNLDRNVEEYIKLLVPSREIR